MKWTIEPNLTMGYDLIGTLKDPVNDRSKTVRIYNGTGWKVSTLESLIARYYTKMFQELSRDREYFERIK